MAIGITGDREVFDQMLFGPAQPAMLQYMQQTNNYFMGMMTDVGRQFVEHAQNVFARTNSSEAMELARAAMRVSNTYFQEDIIYTMNSVEQLQEAPDSMVRWIMTHPELRRLYHDERVCGYSDRYQDTQPQPVYGWDHLDYQVVYSGWMETTSETVKVDGDKTEEVHYDEWTEVLVDEDDIEQPMLLDVEAVSIQLAHKLVDIAIAENRDPTSYYDNQIV